MKANGQETGFWAKFLTPYDNGDTYFAFYQQDDKGKYFRHQGAKMLVSPEHVIGKVRFLAQSSSS